MKVLQLIGILIFTGSVFPKQYLPAADLSDLEIWDIWDEENNKTGDVRINRCNRWATGTLIIPETIEGKTVKIINGAAFDGCENLTSIILPESVQEIGDRAFKGCFGLTTFVVPDQVTRIGENAFESCYELKTIKLGRNVTAIGRNIFLWCRDLTNIIFKGNAPIQWRWSGEIIDPTPVEEPVNFKIGNWDLGPDVKITAKKGAIGFNDRFGGLPVIYVDMIEQIRPVLQPQIRRLGNNQVALSFPSRNGKKYTIQRSIDLKNWESVESRIPGTDNLIEKLYPASQPNQFFKLVQEEVADEFFPDFIRTIRLTSGNRVIDLDFGFSPTAKDGNDGMDIPSPSKAGKQFWAEWIDGNQTYSRQIFEGTKKDTEEHIFRLKIPYKNPENIVITWDNVRMAEVFSSMSLRNVDFFEGPRDWDMLVNDNIMFKPGQSQWINTRELLVRVTPKNTLIVPAEQSTTFNLRWEGNGKTINGKLIFPLGIDSVPNPPLWGRHPIQFPSQTIAGGTFSITIDGKTNTVYNPHVSFYRYNEFFNREFDFTKELLGQGGFGPQFTNGQGGDFNIFNGTGITPTNYFTIRDSKGISYKLTSMRLAE